METICEQINTQMIKAFWDILEDEAKTQGPFPQIEILLQELIKILCSFVPSRSDIHEKIKEDLQQPIGFDLQKKLINWIEKFQSPEHDKITKIWKEEGLVKISKFLKRYHDHLQIVHKEVFDYRKKLSNGENIFEPEVPKSRNGIPANMKSGFK
jgi:hypothetical protein